jgi:hypothetical protein
MDNVDGLSSEVRARIVRQRCTQEGPIGPARQSGSQIGGAHWCRDTEKRTRTSHERVIFLRDILKRIFRRILVFGLHIFGQNSTVAAGNGKY